MLTYLRRRQHLQLQLFYTSLGGLVTGAMVILALRFLTPYFYYIPKASLAAVIVCAVIFMVDLDVIKPMWRSKSEQI